MTDRVGAGDADETVSMAHGAGTGRTREFVTSTVLPRFDDDAGEVGLAALDDGAVHDVDGTSVAVTTDSHVVDPPTFPGGDLGRLAVAGTVNDLAAMGATEPSALTCALVAEAGTAMATVERVLDSMADTADAAGGSITTGDTKVMRSGEVDGIVVNTTGVGQVDGEGPLAATRITPGDRVLVTGPVGDHGIAVLAEREGFEFESDLESDVAPVNDLVRIARETGTVRTATDPTRGGIATATNELVADADVGIRVDERSIPVDEATGGAAEVLGIDPLSVACEGRMIVVVAPDDAERVRDRLREHPRGRDAAIVGSVVDDHHGQVVLDTGIGERFLTVPEDRRLPRIC